MIDPPDFRERFPRNTATFPPSLRADFSKLGRLHANSANGTVRTVPARPQAAAPPSDSHRKKFIQHRRTACWSISIPRTRPASFQSLRAPSKGIAMRISLPLVESAREIALLLGREAAEPPLTDADQTLELLGSILRNVNRELEGGKLYELRVARGRLHISLGESTVTVTKTRKGGLRLIPPDPMDESTVLKPQRSDGFAIDQVMKEIAAELLRQGGITKPSPTGGSLPSLRSPFRTTGRVPAGASVTTPVGPDGQDDGSHS